MVAIVLVSSAREDRKALGSIMRIFHELLQKGDLFIRFLVDVGKDVGEAHCRNRSKERQEQQSVDERKIHCSIDRGTVVVGVIGKDFCLVCNEDIDLNSLEMNKNVSQKIGILTEAVTHTVTD